MALPTDPVTGTLGLVGLGLQLWGQSSAANAAKEEANVSSNTAGLEGQINDQKRQQMELSARRQLLEVYRNTQRARALGVEAAVNQGAQNGSGLAGGQATTQSEGLFNALGIQQNLEVGRNIFGLTGQIGQNNMQLAKLKGEQTTDQGWASLGGSLLSSAGTIGNISQSAGPALSNGITVPGYNPFKGMLS